MRLTKARQKQLLDQNDGFTKEPTMRAAIPERNAFIRFPRASYI